MKSPNIAFDRSARRIDADGRLHVDKSHISKAVVNPYYGKEIPGWDTLGLDPDKIYQMLRDPAELEKAAGTFARLPILSKHVPVNVDEPQKDLVVGAIGSDVEFVFPYLDASLCFWDAAAIAGIETEQVIELSCAYRYIPVMEPGEFEGVKYDGRMTQLQGNHLALVEVGRAGSDVLVADHNPFHKEISTMKTTKLGRALIVALGLASPKLAQDSALPALVGKATRANFNKKDVVEKVHAMDEDLDPQQLDNIVDAIIGVEDDPKPSAAVGDDDPASSASATPAPAEQSMKDKIIALLTGKVDEATMNSVVGLLVEDEDPGSASPAAPAAPEGGAANPEDITQAMDALSAKMRANTANLIEALQAVRPVVGDVIGMDSGEAVYKFALEQMGVDCKAVKELGSLKAMFSLAQSRKPAAPTMAHDAGGETVKQFPGVGRFGTA